MLRLTFALAGLALLTGCRNSAPDRREPASEQPRAPVQVGRAEQPQTTAVGAVPDMRATQSTSAQPRAKPSMPRKPKRKAPAPQPATASDPAPRSDPSTARPDTDPLEIAPPPATQPPDTGSGPSEVSTQPSKPADTLGYTSYPATTPPESAPAPAPAARGVVAAGTVIHASLEDSINSRRDMDGKQVRGEVMQNITGAGGEVLVPAGSQVSFTVTRLKPGRGKGRGELEMRADSIIIEGKSRKLEAKIDAVPHELKGRGVTGDEAAKVGIGAVGGAVAGRVITGKTRGAVIGGVVGAAGGAAVASQTAAKDVVVKAKTPVQVMLTAPLVIR